MIATMSLHPQTPAILLAALMTTGVFKMFCLGSKLYNSLNTPESRWGHVETALTDNAVGDELGRIKSGGEFS